MTVSKITIVVASLMIAVPALLFALNIVGFIYGDIAGVWSLIIFAEVSFFSLLLSKITYCGERNV